MNTAQQVVLAVFGVVTGFAIGSFMCVVIERLPVALDEPDEFGDAYGTRPWHEVLGGSSRCSSCGAPIHWYDKIPVVSWLVLKGTCRECESRIPAFHPFVELAVPAVGIGVALAMGWGWRLLPVLLVVPIGIAVSIIDMQTFIVPTRLIWPAFGLVFALSIVAAFAAGERGWLLGGLVGILTLAGPLFIIWFIRPGAMGFGDVRLSVLLGWMVGFAAINGSWVTAMFVSVAALALASTVGIVFAVVGLSARGRNARVPFGPALVVGALVCASFAPEILDGFNIR